MEPTEFADRNLLFGLLALQMDYLTQDALLAAMKAWVWQKHKPLGQHLQEQGVLDERQHKLLDAFVEEHLRQHGNSVAKSLAALTPPTSIRDQLHQLADPVVSASLASVTPSFDPYATEAPSASTSPAGTSAQPSADWLRYSKLHKHAEGGLGVVFLAKDKELNREVALKEIKDRFADDAGSRTRFTVEAEVTGNLEHPGIVPIYALGAYPDGRPYYAMRFIRGESLKDALTRCHANGPCDFRRAPLELRKLLGHFVTVCNAIAYAHGRGMLHRDLKPANVMLGEYGETLVVDWGLAKPMKVSEDSTLPERPIIVPSSGSGVGATQMGELVGTPQYMSPEQAAGRIDELGAASDVYALGSTLYHVLTGKVPYAGQDVFDVVQRVREGRFPRLRESNPGVARSLEAICNKAMALRIKDRYASAKALAGDLERWLADEPVSAYREPFLPRMARWVRKHRGRSAAILASVVVGLTVVVAVVLVREAGDREQQAREQADRESGLRTEADSARARAETAEEKSRRYLYVTRMNLAERALREGRDTWLRDLLQEQVPTGEREDLRGFEWYHLQQLANRQLGVMEVSKTPVRAVAVSADGRHVVTGSEDGGVRVWEGSAGRLLHQIKGHKGAVTGVSIRADGQRAYSGGVDGQVIAWDVATGKEARRMQNGAAGGGGLALTLSPDGKWLVASRDERLGVMVWDAETGRAVGHVRAPGGSIRALAFHPNSKRLAIASFKTVSTWDLEENKEAQRMEMALGQRVRALAFSPDGENLAGAMMDQTVRVWELPGGEPKHVLKDHARDVYAVCWLGAEVVASAGGDGTVRAWNLTKPSEPLILNARAGVVWAMAALPGQRRIVSAHADGKVRTWNARVGQEGDVLRGDERSVHGVAFHPRQPLLATAGESGAIQVWDTEKRAVVRGIPGHKARASAVVFTPDGKWLISAGHDRAVRVWDANTGKMKIELEEHESEVEAVAVSPDGGRIASADWDGNVYLRDRETGKKLWSIRAHDRIVRAVAFSPDGKQVATGGGDRLVKLWDAATGQSVASLPGHNDEVSALAFSPDGQTLVSGGYDTAILVWNVETRQQAARVSGHAEWVLGVAFLPDGSRFVTCSRDETGRLWDARSLQETLTLRGHNRRVYGVAVRGDGRRIATAGEDGTVRLWDAPR